jgi:O-antigen ligase
MLSQRMSRLRGMCRLPAHLAAVGGLTSQTAVQITAALGFGIILGLVTLATSPLVALGGMIGLILLAMAFTSPEVVILVVLCFASGLVPNRLDPFVSLPFGHAQVSDLVLLWLLFVVLFRVFTDKSFCYVETPLDLPILLFYGSVLVGLGTAVLRFGVAFSDATYEARMLMYYLIFFAVTNLIRTRSQLVRLARGVLTIGLLLAVMMIAQATLGRSTALMDDWLRQSGGEVARSFHPGFTSVYVVLIALVSYMALCEHVRHSLGRWLQVLVLGAGLLTTVGRNIVVSGAITLILLAVLLRKSEMSRLTRRLILVGFIAAGLIAALGIVGEASFLVEYSNVYMARLSSMFSADILKPGENLWPRWQEIRFAWAQILEHPILGIGLYNPYRPAFYPGDHLRHYIHNAYLSLWLKAGLAGLVSFLWFSAVFLWRGFRHWRNTQDDFLGSAMLGFTLAFLGMMISNLVAPSFVEGGSLAIFGVVLGLNESIMQHSETTNEDKKGSVSHGLHKTTAQG